MRIVEGRCDGRSRARAVRVELRRRCCGGREGRWGREEPDGAILAPDGHSECRLRPPGAHVERSWPWDGDCSRRECCDPPARLPEPFWRSLSSLFTFTQTHTREKRLGRVRERAEPESRAVVAVIEPCSAVASSAGGCILECALSSIAVECGEDVTEWRGREWPSWTG